MPEAAGFSSSGTEKRSRNPVRERGTVRNALFSEEGKARTDGSPLKGCAAQPCLPANSYRQAAGKLPSRPEVKRRSSAGDTGCPSPVKLHVLGATCNYFAELGTDFYTPKEIRLCNNHVFAGSHPPPVEIHNLEFPHSRLVEPILFLLGFGHKTED